MRSWKKLLVFVVAIGLLVVGLGLFAVAQVRRRQPNLA